MRKKQTSSRISAIAAKYLRMSDDDLWMLATAKPLEDRKPFFAAIRSMAASLLSQDEKKGQNP